MGLRDEISLLFTGLHARRDAKNGVDASTRRELVSKSRDPREAARGTHRYQQAVRDANLGHVVTEYEDELRRAEDLQAVVGRPWPWTFGLCLVVAAEVAGTFLVLKAVGVEPHLRPILAVGLTATLIGVTKGVEYAIGGKGNAKAPILPRLGVTLAWASLILAVAYIRGGGGEGDDTSEGITPALGVFFIALTAGPAVVATWLERKRAPAAELARQVSLIRKRLRDTHARHARARAYLENLDDEGVAHDRESTRQAALYSIEHEIARAQAERKRS